MEFPNYGKSNKSYLLKFKLINNLNDNYFKRNFHAFCYGKFYKLYQNQFENEQKFWLSLKSGIRNSVDQIPPKKSKTKFFNSFESHASVQFENYLYISFPLPFLNSSSTLPFPFFPLGRVEEKKGSRKGIIFGIHDYFYLLIDHIL
ncbi:hypothetical protein BpHYR1_008243 [Brachionus plicatilis]|uniref:Uncharacterized protein n=1 Tax=Brachionus plicatilis TaxID=10195 RepID=A0A3M7Q911_BRAPC|nr:hypothetical protein BpHYR1_008243 [Brachionus plicatilis]